MQQDGPKTPYEIYCHNCHVTYAAGTPRCVHCGQRLKHERVERSLLLPPGMDDELLAEETPQRSRMFSPMTAIWIILALTSVIYRACTSSG